MSRELLKSMWGQFKAAHDNYIKLTEEWKRMNAERDKTAERIALIKKLLELDDPGSVAG
ncbi:MAG: hypothetical protein ACHP7P_11255 [Terriglobales bacterium]